MDLEFRLETCCSGENLFLGVEDVVNINVHVVTPARSCDQFCFQLSMSWVAQGEYPIALANSIARYFVSLDDCLAIPM